MIYLLTEVGSSMKAMEISLSEKSAHQYVIEQLQDGNTLAQLILQKTSFDKGRYFALLHPLANKSKIYEFKSGGILPPNPLEAVEFGGKSYPGRKRADSIIQLAEYLKNSMRPNRCCYFEDLLHRREDPIANKFRANTLYYLEEPYLFLRNNNFSTEDVLKMIRYSDAQWHFMSVVSEEDVGSSLEISEEKLQKIASGTVSIAIGAYDMEGFVIWEKKT
jgi:hypothetical protein